MSLPKYGNYKVSGIDWLPKIPAHWNVCPLKRVASLQSGESITAEQIEDAGAYPVYGGNGLRGFTTAFTHEGRFALIGRQGALCGNVNYSQGKFWASEHAVVATPLKPANTTWLGEMLRAMNLNQYSVSAAQPGLSVELISRIVVPYPPLDEQTAIAAFLDRETTKIDTLIAEQEKLIALLVEKRQATISHAVTKGVNPNAQMKDSGVAWLGTISAHWNVTRIKYVVERTDGIQMGPFGGMLLDLATVDTGFKVYGQENTISGDFSRGSRWISEARFRELARYRLQIGDLVLTRKGSLGNARLVQGLPQPGICDSDTIRVRVDEQAMRSEFLATLLHEAEYVAIQLAMAKRGAILSGVNTETIANLCVVAPPPCEQKEILDCLKVRLAEFKSVADSASKAIALLKERRSALIAAAVTGQIDVRGTTPRAAADSLEAIAA